MEHLLHWRAPSYYLLLKKASQPSQGSSLFFPSVLTSTTHISWWLGSVLHQNAFFHVYYLVWDEGGSMPTLFSVNRWRSRSLWKFSDLKLKVFMGQRKTGKTKLIEQVEYQRWWLNRVSPLRTSNNTQESAHPRGFCVKLSSHHYPHWDQ